jgi:cephalosporin hydroxylase
MYEPKWFGVPVIQFPNDIVVMQELIHREKPTKIIECGVAHGGSLLYYASLFELMGQGEVIGVEVELRDHNRKAIMESPFYHRIKLVDGSSTAPESIEAVKSYLKPDDRVMVFLDSNHSTEHVKKELELYSPFVSQGSYIVAMDTAQRLVCDMPRGKPEWVNDNPWEAVKMFMEGNSEFEIDPYWTRLRISCNEDGFLRRVK